MEWVTISDAECIASTRKSIRVTADILEEEIWIPLSQVSDDSEVYRVGTTGDLIISASIAREKGLD